VPGAAPARILWPKMTVSEQLMDKLPAGEAHRVAGEQRPGALPGGQGGTFDLMLLDGIRPEWTAARSSGGFGRARRIGGSACPSSPSRGFPKGKKEPRARPGRPEWTDSDGSLISAAGLLAAAIESLGALRGFPAFPDGGRGARRPARPSHRV